MQVNKILTTPGLLRVQNADLKFVIGMEGSEYQSILARDIDTTPRYAATGTATCMAANRISYAFNLSGPSIVVDTACSSAMVALHQAVRSLQGDEANMALVCGAKLILSPDMFVPSSEMGFLSSSGRCRSFDAAADGYGRGEGVLALLLKPLQAALSDLDPIRAIVKGARLNQDGKTRGITLPSADAQRRNMQSLYKRLNICPDDIQYLEAHVSILIFSTNSSANILDSGNRNSSWRSARVLRDQCRVQQPKCK